jgi:hypothetical protein
VQLNNGSMQGVFDQDMLGGLMSAEFCLAEFCGFTQNSCKIHMFGGDERFAELFPDTDAVKTTKSELVFCLNEFCLNPQNSAPQNTLAKSRNSATI